MIDQSSWPEMRGGEALTALAVRSGLVGMGALAAPAAPTLRASALALGLDITPRRRTGAAAAADLAPCLVRVDGGAWVAVRARTGRRLHVLTPDGHEADLDLDHFDTPPPAARQRLLGTLDAAARDRADQALRELDPRAAVEVLPVRRALGSNTWADLRRAGVGWTLAAALGLDAVGSGAVALGWVLVGSAAFAGTLTTSHIVGWLLALATGLAAGLGATRASEHVALGVAAALRARWMRALLDADPGALAKLGSVDALNRLLDAQLGERAAIEGALGAARGGLQVAWTVGLLALVPGPAVELVAFGVACAIVLALSFRGRGAYAERLARQREITGALGDAVLGDETRRVQAPPETWHRREDRELFAYEAACRQVDEGLRLPLGVLPRVWFLTALALLLATPGIGDPVAASVAVAALLTGTGALGQLGRGGADLALTWAIWQAHAGLLRPAAGSAARRGGVGSPSRPSLRIDGLRLERPGNGRPLLDGASLDLEAGDAVLLSGPSGAGKSTLAEAVVGLLRPAAGSVSLGGIDARSIDPVELRRRVVWVPQFHQNHVFAGSFAFNALLRDPDDVDDDAMERLRSMADAVGLGPLISRMPAGLGQPLGDGGWQLSHGERSRLYLLRALVRPDAHLLLLDESLAALDPTQVAACVDVARRTVPMVIFVAHP